MDAEIEKITEALQWVVKKHGQLLPLKVVRVSFWGIQNKEPDRVYRRVSSLYGHEQWVMNYLNRGSSTDNLSCFAYDLKMDRSAMTMEFGNPEFGDGVSIMFSLQELLAAHHEAIQKYLKDVDEEFGETGE